MPVLKDLIVNMDAVHWKKVQRVVPWLLPDGDPPEREYVVPAESMIDITQSMACIHCGACNSDCLSLEVDPLFIGPAALAKAYRFVGDPRDGQTEERLRDLAEDPHGIYDCTHCFSCVEVCPKGVAPMDQIMRLRRKAVHDHGINDQNNGARHEQAFTKIIRKKGTLDERKLLQDSLGPFRPQGGIALLKALPDGPARLRARQDHAEDGAPARDAARASRTCAASTSTPRSTAPSSTCTSWARAASPTRRNRRWARLPR